MALTSANFAFLEKQDPLLHRCAALAERNFADDPNTCMAKMRMFAESLAHATCASLGSPRTSQEDLVDVLRAMDYRVPERVVDWLHDLRKLGNKALHENLDTHKDALVALKVGHRVAEWYHATFRIRGFKAGPFNIPPDPAAATVALAAELAAMRDAAAERAAEVAGLRDQAEAIARLKAEAEDRAAKLYEDQQAATELIDEVERARADDRARFEAQLAALREQTPPPTPAVVADLVSTGAAVAATLELDEATTRRLIDAQLARAGWEADTFALRWSSGTRPQKGRRIAIAEVPTASGPVDYVLFDGLVARAVVEAKRGSVDVPGVLASQAERYARDLAPATANTGRTWGEHRVPFAFATNGRSWLRQLDTKSGVWFRDLRAARNHAHPLGGWYTPDGLAGLLDTDVDASEAALETEPFDDLKLYDFQIEAIRSVERELAAGRRTMLLAMATGTGKTRTAVGLIYRLLKARRFRRVLFLVDRTSLGDQALATVGHMPVEGYQPLDRIYDVKGLEDATPDADTRLHLTTIQGLVRRVMYTDDPPPIDQYDCIVVDECHRGYAMDRELSDDELTFRDEADYVSKYRRVLEHFDAVKVGLTATPALHTKEIFGRPVFTYSYREAVIDGRLIDHEAPTRIVTALAEDGVTWLAHEPIQQYHVRTGQIDLLDLPDEVNVDVEGFNRKVLVPAFNDAICEELVKHLDPAAPGKALVFCVRDDHADEVVAKLKSKLQERWGAIPDDHVMKITGRTDDPARAIRLYKNEPTPKIAVTVDLLTTGIDVPAITDLVFLRRIRSRILYEQMLGRATRKCDEIRKDVFRIYDCVDLYASLEDYSSMKPVVPSPATTFASLVRDIGAVRDPALQKQALDQIVAKWQRRRRKLHGDDLRTFQDLTGVAPDDFAKHLTDLGPAEAAVWLADRPSLIELLDAPSTPSDPTMLISDHPDEIRRVERGYGNAKRPEDYLEGFKAFVEANQARIPALMVVTQRPRELTRKQLRELAIELDKAGYSERTLRTAWRDLKNEDIGATIVGHVRQAALGSPLVSYEERVERGLARLLGSREWTVPQQKWLRKFANQLQAETVVDRDALDRGQFKAEGGYARLNRVFDGRLDDVIADLTDSSWRDVS